MSLGRGVATPRPYWMIADVDLNMQAAIKSTFWKTSALAALSLVVFCITLICVEIGLNWALPLWT